MPQSQIEIDINNDGKVDAIEMELFLSKTKTQRRMALVALYAIILSGVYLMGFAPIERILALGSVVDMLWLSLTGVISVYMGATAFMDMNRKKGGARHGPPHNENGGDYVR